PLHILRVTLAEGLRATGDDFARAGKPSLGLSERKFGRGPGRRLAVKTTVIAFVHDGLSLELSQARFFFQQHQYILKAKVGQTREACVDPAYELQIAFVV